MDWDFEARSGEALAALDQGETVEAILSRYPEDAEALRPILEMARELQALPLAYSVSGQQASRQAMLAEARRLRDRRTPVFTRFSGLRRLGFALGALLVLFVAASSLLARPVATALPGQALYPLKRAAEDMQLRLAADPAPLATRFLEERRQELLAVVATGQEAELDCAGTIRTIADDRWQTDDFVLFIPAQSAVEGIPAIGAPFEGRCQVRDGQVFALDIRISGPGKLPSELPSPTPAPPSPTPTPTATPTATATPTPTATDTPEASLPGGPVPTPDDDGGDDNSGAGSGDDNSGSDGSDNSSDDSGSGGTGSGSGGDSAGG
jgi:hypothetical protein